MKKKNINLERFLAEGKGFRDVCDINCFGTIEIGYSTGDFDDFEVTTGGELEFGGCLKQELLSGRRELYKFFDFSRTEGTVMLFHRMIAFEPEIGYICNSIFYNIFCKNSWRWGGVG